MTTGYFEPAGEWAGAAPAEFESWYETSPAETEWGEQMGEEAGEGWMEAPVRSAEAFEEEDERSEDTARAETLDEWFDQPPSESASFETRAEDLAPIDTLGLLEAGEVGEPLGEGPAGAVGTWMDRFRVSMAVARGERDEVALTNLVFFSRHPELGGRKLRPDERNLVQEWTAIRDDVVRPVLRLAGAAARPPSPGPAASRPPGPAPAPRGGALRSTTWLRHAWESYRCNESAMVPVHILSHTTPVNPLAVDAFQALDRALRRAGYEAKSTWVYNCRSIQDASGNPAGWSLHAYGLAVDIDPRCHPHRRHTTTPVRFSSRATQAERCDDVRRGAADTAFTPAQVAAVEAIRTVDGQQVFAWGGRWRTAHDSMHFQVNVSPEELRRGLAAEAHEAAETLEEIARADQEYFDLVGSEQAAPHDETMAFGGGEEAEEEAVPAEVDDHEHHWEHELEQGFVPGGWEHPEQEQELEDLDLEYVGQPEHGYEHAPVGELPSGGLGTLTLAAPGLPGYSYRFSPEDAMWTSKLIVLEAGGTDDAENAAVIWAMFNRYALFTRRVFPTFTRFIRAYSTTLQPVLRSPSAAQRHMHSPGFVRTGGFYKGTDIPRGQLRRHLDVQAQPWEAVSATARALTLRALRGAVPNPGIGLASEFASTRIFWKVANRTRREPTHDEWRRYTEAYAGRRRPPALWIGEVPHLDQLRNAFFVDRRAEHLPPEAVRVVPPS